MWSLRDINIQSIVSALGKKKKLGYRVEITAQEALEPIEKKEEIIN